MKMPVYEYLCINGHKLEEFLNLKDFNKVVLCPICKGSTKRIFSVYGFRLDGKFHHSEGYVPPDLEGYHPEKNDAIAEMKGDLKRLEERRMTENNPKRRHDLKEALRNFKEDYDDRIRLNQIAGKSK